VRQCDRQITELKGHVQKIYLSLDAIEKNKGKKYRSGHLASP